MIDDHGHDGQTNSHSLPALLTTYRIHAHPNPSTKPRLRMPLGARWCVWWSLMRRRTTQRVTTSITRHITVRQRATYTPFTYHERAHPQRIRPHRLTAAPPCRLATSLPHTWQNSLAQSASSLAIFNSVTGDMQGTQTGEGLMRVGELDGRVRRGTGHRS